MRKPLKTPRNFDSFVIKDPPASVIARSHKSSMLQNHLKFGVNELKKLQNGETRIMSSDLKNYTAKYPFRDSLKLMNFKLLPSYLNNLSGNRLSLNMKLKNKNYNIENRQANFQYKANFPNFRNINGRSWSMNFGNSHALLSARHQTPFSSQKHESLIIQHSTRTPKIQDYKPNTVENSPLSMKRIRSVSSQNLKMNGKIDSRYILFASVCVPVVVAILFCLWKMKKVENGFQGDKSTFRYHRLKNCKFGNNALNKVEKFDTPEFSFKSYSSSNPSTFLQTDMNLSCNDSYYNYDISEQTLAAKNNCRFSWRPIKMPPIDLLTYNGYTNKNERVLFGKTYETDLPPSSISNLCKSGNVLKNQSYKNNVDSSILDASSAVSDMSHAIPLSYKELQDRYKGVVNSADLDSSIHSSSSSSLFSISNSDYIKSNQFEYKSGFYASYPFLLIESFDQKVSLPTNSSKSDMCLSYNTNESLKEKNSFQLMSTDFTKSEESFASATESVGATDMISESWTHQEPIKLDERLEEKKIQMSPTGRVEFSDSSSSESSFDDKDEIIVHEFVL
ncbi:hypothetical protein HNY73_013158 [Argiope bruennichi]|uniref:Uncharacterized protein n=1 Tax=Argiope bruennichi TaxID=94029 RepID=A0A8T0EZA0_ARGBR|nr:hypothetical protein HNY73_013158 [Argiope bruennichi]